MKKKLLALLLASAMVVSMAACGNTDSQPESSQANDSAQDQSADAQEESGEDSETPLRGKRQQFLPL